MAGHPVSVFGLPGRLGRVLLGWAVAWLGVIPSTAGADYIGSASTASAHASVQGAAMDETFKKAPKAKAKGSEQQELKR